MRDVATVKVRLFRFDPERDEAPGYTTHLVPRTRGMRVLDALTHIYETDQDSDVAFRWFCGTKKCGECAMTVNGVPMLSCWEAAADEMTIEPLANFPIIRDLVVDTQPYEQMIIRLQPRLRRTESPAFPEVISHDHMTDVQKLIKCIECNVCTAATPAPSLNPDGVAWDGNAGAAALVRFSRFVLDVRDETDRRGMAVEAGLDRFPLFQDLARICPQGIDILEDAVLPARRRLFGEASGDPVALAASTVFVSAPGWSAFVRLADDRKRELLAAGVLAPRHLAGIDEAYNLNARLPA